MFRRFLFAATLLATLTAHAQQPTVAERYLFIAANSERAAAGLTPLRWNLQLVNAARGHAYRMAREGAISHGFAGEPDLTARAAASGAHFSTVAENVGVSPTAPHIHDAWMHSEGHRANILDPRLTSVGIAIVSTRNGLWTVQDFDRDVEDLSVEEQEQQVADLLARDGALHTVQATEAARKTCSMQKGYAGGQRPWFVMRYTASDLSRLPEQLRTKLMTGHYTQVNIGACQAHERGFTAYSIAVMLFP